jgi:hypothetical protein
VIADWLRHIGYRSLVRWSVGAEVWCCWPVMLVEAGRMVSEGDCLVVAAEPLTLLALLAVSC